MGEEASNMDDMVVEIVSKENILPASPTPNHLRTFKLSVLDQTQVKFYVPMMLFYVNNLNSVISDRSKLLKQTLSETLTRFYPLAGKVKDAFYIDCNDQGVYYIETRVNSRLLDFLAQSPGNELISKLVPQEATESPIGNYVLINQVNIFSCGGIAICTCISHKYVDGNTYILFLKDWTARARGGSSSEMVDPSYIAPSLFPQIPSLSFENPICISKIKSVSQRFVFDGVNIAALKAKTKVLSAGNEATRFEVVSALLWKCVVKAANKVNDSSLEKPFNMGVIINFRGKNGVPKNAVGNLVWPGFAQSKLAPKLEHEYLVDQIKKCKAEINDDFVEALKGDKGTPIILKIAEMLTSGEISCSLWITSMCNMDLYELDFGWGKPAWFYYFHLNILNFISLSDTRAGGGIEAVVSLSQQEMTIFENDPELLAFASLNPVPL